MTTGPRSVGVAGAGPAGLAAALFLARQGRQVVIHERFDRPAPVGAGFMLQPTGLHVLVRLGLTDRIEAQGRPLERLLGREARQGRVVLDVRYASLRRPRRPLGVHRAALFDVLYQACVDEGVIFEPGFEVAGAEAGRFMASSGRRGAPFDLLIDASGAGSELAAALPGARRPLRWGALWITVPWPGAPFDPAALEQVYSGASRMVGLMPCGRRPGDDRQLAAFFWSLRSDHYAAWRNRSLDNWKAEVTTLWPQIAPALAAIESHDDMTMARYGHRTLRRPIVPGLAVIGDAAHQTSPQLGQGVNMGLLDALTLAQSLEQRPELDDALAEYARRRRWHVRLYQALSSIFTPFYQSGGVVEPWVRDHILCHVARAPGADRLLAATVSGLLLDPRR